MLSSLPGSTSPRPLFHALERRARLLAGGFALLFLAASGVVAGTRDAQWHEVDEAARGLLSKTAIEKLDPILAGALADKSYAEAIKALCRKIDYTARIEGKGPEEKIARFQAELEKAPTAMKPMMEAILAQWYWTYYQDHRGQFLQRTQISTGGGSDLATWDLGRILAEIDRHFTAALADEAVLKATPIRDYDELFQKGTAPDDYRPTLYDFLVYQALEFYQAGEQPGTAAEGEFELSAASPIFADVTEFMHWAPHAAEDTAPKLKAIRLYQSLLRFHEADADRSAFYDADLARLRFGENTAVGNGRDERYKAALQRFAAVTSHHPISTRAFAALAMKLHGDGDAVQAREVARRGLAAFPESAGGAMCSQLIHEIEAKSAALGTECVWNAPWPTLDVTYRNVTKVYFRAVPVDFSDCIKRVRRRFNDIDDDDLALWLAAKPVLAWDANLAPTTDYKPRTVKLPAPATLKPGFYLIIASHDAAFRSADNQIDAAFVCVSDLALIVRTRHDGGMQSGLVLRAASGEPVEGATVRFWEGDDDGHFRETAPTETDQNGRFQFPSGNHRVGILAEKDGQAVWSRDEVRPYKERVGKSTDAQTIFFTDRALYRPGQTINYKGISIRYNSDAGKYSVRSGHAVTVVFYDVNGREIARTPQRTNDYGSFSGVFTAPRDRLPGRMTIQALDQPGAASVNVEEYKRPKFQVELLAPAEAAKLDTIVEITGRATAYTGAPIGEAKVSWRVQREVRLPDWCWWWGGQSPADQAVAHGTAVTAADGTFKVRFPAMADHFVPAKDEPMFVFSVHADVTDTTGETRSNDRAIVAGYTALQASLSVDEWQADSAPVNVAIETKSLDGDPQPANGAIKVYALRQPGRVVRPPVWPQPFAGRFDGEPPVDPANPDSWQLGQVVVEQTFKTASDGKAQVAVSLKAGIYRVALETADRFGQKVTARQTVQVLSPRDPHYRVRLPNIFSAPKWSVEPGEKFGVLWGTGYKTGRAFVEIECQGKLLKSYWTAPDRTQEFVEQAVTEDMRGGFTVRVTFARENRAYINERVVDVPWSSQRLTVKWESFRSKLAPGQKETWTAVVTGPNGQRAAAEMVAALYDASLDQYAPHGWPSGFDVFRRESSRVSSAFQNGWLDFFNVHTWDWTGPSGPSWQYRTWLAEVTQDMGEIETLTPFTISTGRDSGYLRTNSATSTRIGMEIQKEKIPMSVSAVSAEFIRDSGLVSGNGSRLGYTADEEGAALAGSRIDLNKVSARKKLNETAFFFPQLVAGPDGVVKMSFTMPEALTEWKFLGFAHDRKLRAGYLVDKAVTSKDLMVEPNPPRFVREGDAIEFTVKVTNRTATPQAGTVRLTFASAATQQPMDDALANRATEQAFDVPAQQSHSYAWRIAVPDGMDFLTYKAVAATDKFSDGEEGYLPVLSRRVLVTESLPLPIRGPATKPFAFKKLHASGASTTLRQQSLTVQMVSHPAWYAVLALPYLMEYPYECSEQVFNRLYANVLARHLANSDPKIRRVFDLWKATPALDSPLEKNQDVKSVLLEETPWVRAAQAESQARRNVGLLFDANRLDEETARTLQELSDRQLSDGRWSWFPGGASSDYISLYIMTGFGRLRHLGVEVDVQLAVKCLAALDAGMTDHYRRVRKSDKPENYVPSSSDALDLYGRSFFLEDQPVAAPYREALDFFLQQARKFWTKVESRQSQAHLALALQRFGDKATPLAIMRSLKERSVNDEELGMFWRDARPSWWWWDAPIETQALMIEAFAEVTHDAAAVEACKVWLLKQKQTQDWTTTRSTADAVYALLLRGDGLLSSDALVEVSLGGERLKPGKVEAGTGFYERKFVRDEIKPAMGDIVVKKTDPGVSWGSVSWQYLEDIAKVTPHIGTPLQLRKALFVKETTAKGAVLKPVTGRVAVGDELVVRLELRADRDMDFVHLKDQRGSGTEPVNVLSQYKYQDGLAYYETTRDATTHFFIEHLPRGVYVFEYSVRVQLKGHYETGLAEIQCMYAPEFNSHSESIALTVE